MEAMSDSLLDELQQKKFCTRESPRIGCRKGARAHPDGRAVAQQDAANETFEKICEGEFTLTQMFYHDKF